MSGALTKELIPKQNLPNSSAKVSIVSQGSAAPSIISTSESSSTSHRQLNLPNSSRLTDLATYSGGLTLRDRLLTPPRDEFMYRQVKESLKQGGYKSPTASSIRVVRRVDEAVPDATELHDTVPQTRPWLIQAKESLLRLVPWRKGKDKSKINPNSPIEYIKEAGVKRSTSDTSFRPRVTSNRPIQRPSLIQRASSLRSKLIYPQDNQRAPTATLAPATQTSGLSNSSVEALPSRFPSAGMIPPTKHQSKLLTGTTASTSRAGRMPSSDALDEVTEEARRLAVGFRRSWYFQNVSES